MFSTTWNRLWEMHDQVKDMFTFFIKPNSSKVVTKGNSEKSVTKQPGGGGGYTPRSYTTAQIIGLILGPLLFILTMMFLNPEGLSTEAKGVLASTLWIATWWITEAIPIPVTSLLPLVLFPLTKSLDMKVTASSYGERNDFPIHGWIYYCPSYGKMELT